MRFNKLPPDLKDLEIGLKRLDFINNFRSFSVEVTIPATSEVSIKNMLAPSIPSLYLIGRQTGNGLITDGPTEWSENRLYLYNNGATEVVATIIFLE